MTAQYQPAQGAQPASQVDDQAKRQALDQPEQQTDR